MYSPSASFSDASCSASVHGGASGSGMATGVSSSWGRSKKDTVPFCAVPLRAAAVFDGLVDPGKEPGAPA